MPGMDSPKFDKLSLERLAAEALSLYRYRLDEAEAAERASAEAFHALWDLLSCNVALAEEASLEEVAKEFDPLVNCHGAVAKRFVIGCLVLEAAHIRLAAAREAYALLDRELGFARAPTCRE